MTFTKGQTYEGAFIVRELGADKKSKPYYALHRGDQVLAFALNRWHNPKAPSEILVQYGENRKACADSFVEHQPTVPVFIKEQRTDDLWLCAGHFKLLRASDDPAEKKQRLQPPEIPAIYKILFLSEVTQP